MYMYMYMYMNVYIYICMCMCIYICIYTHPWNIVAEYSSICMLNKNTGVPYKMGGCKRCDKRLTLFVLRTTAIALVLFARRSARPPALPPRGRLPPQSVSPRRGRLTSHSPRGRYGGGGASLDWKHAHRFFNTKLTPSQGMPHVRSHRAV